MRPPGLFETLYSESEFFILLHVLRMLVKTATSEDNSHTSIVKCIEHFPRRRNSSRKILVARMLVGEPYKYPMRSFVVTDSLATRRFKAKLNVSLPRFRSFISFRNSRISSRKGLVMESDFKNMIMIAVIVNIACYSRANRSVPKNVAQLIS